MEAKHEHEDADVVNLKALNLDTAVHFAEHFG